MKNKSNLNKSQKTALNFALEKKKCALFLPMGMGKTVTSLTFIKEILDDFFVTNVLVIAPKKVANLVWKQETQQWDHLKDLKIQICTGDSIDRIRALDTKADIHVINRENVPWLVENIKWKWDCVIIDESSSFKDQSTKRFKALRKITKELKSIILLSGTPQPNGEMDLWSQMYLIDQGERLGKNITIFRRKYFTPDYMGYSYKSKENAAKEIREKIKDIAITLEIDYDLPEQIEIKKYIELSEEVKKKYKEFEKEFMITLGDTDISSLSAAAMGNKLLQICNGAIYDNDKNTHILHDEKIEVLKELIEDNKGENFLIAYNFKSDLERLKRAFPKAIVMEDSDKIQNDWNAGKIKILLAHPASAGHGLNLQGGGNIIVWFGLNWSLELYQQFNSRLRRQGQKNKVRIIHLMAKNCLDERIMQAIESKASSQSELIKYLKRIVTN